MTSITIIAYPLIFILQAKLDAYPVIWAHFKFKVDKRHAMSASTVHLLIGLVLLNVQNADQEHIKKMLGVANVSTVLQAHSSLSLAEMSA